MHKVLVNHLEGLSLSYYFGGGAGVEGALLHKKELSPDSIARLNRCLPITNTHF